MEKDKAYQKLLCKMLTIEEIGENIYKALSLKTVDNNLKSIYVRLAFNERDSADYIKKEILAIGGNLCASMHGIILIITNFIFYILTERQLIRVLKSALQKRAYSRWHGRYNDRNQDLWRLLLNHENLQHELLQPFWDN